MRLAHLLLLALAAVVLATGCGGDETAAPGTTTETATATNTATTPDTATVETETETVATTGAEEGSGNAANGEEVFASAGCGGCHTLAAAGSSGTIGPNLDDAQPSFDKVIERVTEGQGAMPSFADSLSPQQIRDVAAFVSGATRD